MSQSPVSPPAPSLHPLPGRREEIYFVVMMRARSQALTLDILGHVRKNKIEKRDDREEYDIFELERTFRILKFNFIKKSNS